MTAGGDPYRVLGVPEGASVADVKRAYRLLAKRHHPDAGEGPVARFLEIQAAYEVLVRRDPANGDRPGAARSSPRRPAQQGPRDAGARRTSGERARRGSGPRKATLGSTTYDEASEGGEPTWEGADWYGPVSGTYWTVNPKEDADPRKHGPEYTARGAGRAGTAAPEPAPRSSRGPIPGAAATASSGWEARSRVASASTPPTRTGVGPAAWARLLERLAAVKGRLTGRPWRTRP